MKKLLLLGLLSSSVAQAGLIQRTTISEDSNGKLQVALGYKAKTWSTEVNGAVHSGFKDMGMSLNQHSSLVFQDTLVFDSFLGAGVKNLVGKKDWFLQSGMSLGLVAAEKISAGFGAYWQWDFKKTIDMYPMMNFTVAL